MTEESGGDKLGQLEVDIVGMLAPLEAALARAEQMLTDFDTKWMKRARELGGSMGQAGKRARGAPASASFDANVGSVNDLKVKGLKVEGGAVKLPIDKVDLRSQVLDALKGISIPINVSGVPLTGSVSGTPGQPASAAPEQTRRVFPPEIEKALKQIKGLGDAVDDLHTVIDDSLQAAGKAGLGGAAGDSGAEKMARIFERFNIANGKLVEFVDKTGKKGAVTGGPLGPGSPQLAGLDPNDVKVISQQAKVVSELSKGSAFLSQLADVLPGLENVASPTPSSTVTQQANVVADAVKEAMKEERPKRTEIPASEKSMARPVSREDFIDYVRSVTGPLKGNLPATRSVAVPAAAFGPAGVPVGETPLEALQAAKMGAGRKQGIQGGLGPLTQVLQAVERGLLENFAEEVKKGRRTGTFFPFDPESAQGRRIRSEGQGFLGDTEVKRANPIDLLRSTLTALFPGIGDRTNPTDPMSSLLERVLAGPGRQAIQAGKALSMPSRSTAMDDASQTSRAPAGGPFAPGSAGSLRRSLIDEAKATASQSQEDIIEALRVSAEAGKADSAESRRRIAAGVYQSDIERMATDRLAMAEAGVGFGRYGGVVKGVTGITGTVPEGFAGAGEPESLKSVQLRGGAFTRNAIRRLLEEVDNALYDELGVAGRRRKPKSLPMWVQAERAAAERAIYGPMSEAEASIRDTGGRGFVPRTAMQGRRTGASTAGGASEMTKEFARPVTVLDIERQMLAQTAEAEAAAVALRNFQKREKSISGGEVFDKKTVEDFLRSPAIRKTGGRTVPQGIAPGVRAEAAELFPASARMQDIQTIQRAADAILKAGTDKAAVREITQGVPEGLRGQLDTEIKEILETRTRQSARRPGVRNTRDPLTGDQTRDKFAAAGGILTGEGGGGSGGVGVGGPGGRSFVPGGAPIEVIVIGKFPLPVEFVGTAGGGGGAMGPPGGKPRKNIVDGEAGPSSTRLRRVPTAFTSAEARAQAAQDAADERRFARERSLRQAPGRGGPPASSAEADFMRALLAANDPRAEERQVRQREAEARRLRARSRVSDPEGVARAQDVEDQLQRELRGQLRSLNRRIPRRGFGASLTDLISSLAPGSGSLETQLEAGDLATREAAEISRVSTQRAQTRTTIRGLDRQIAAGGSPQQLQVLNAQRAEQVQLLSSQNKIIAESTRRFNGFFAEATRGTTVLKSFSAAAAGATFSAAAGSVQFGLALAITGPLIQAVAQGFDAVVSPAVERAFGFPGATGRVSGELGDATRAAAGRGEIALAQRAVATGLADATRERIGPALQLRAETEAGNKALQEQIELLHASQRIQAENAGLGGFDKGLVATTSGQFGTQFAGVASTVELIGKELKSIQPPNRSQAELFRNIGVTGGGPRGPLPGLLELDEEGVSKLLGFNLREPEGFGNLRLGPTSRKGIPTARSPEQALAESTLKFFNDAAEKGGSALRFVADEALAAETALKASNAGLHTFAQQILSSGVGIEGLSNRPEDLLKFLQAINKGAAKPEVGALLDTNADQIRASIQARQERLKLTTGTLIPAGIGLEAALEGPIAPAATGITTAGLKPQEVRAVNSELATTQKLFDQINADAKAGQQAAADFVQKALPGQLGGDQFAASLAKVVDLGEQISDIKIDLSTKQAAYQAAQYAYQINIAKRSLQDAKGLTGQIVGDTKNLGVLERQQFQLGREAQQLQLELSQRQINFQVALAGFQAPGLTSEEREARKEAARIEAEFAQKQLDIQKKLFGLQGQQFELGAARQLTDIIGQLGLLEQGRVLNVDTQLAEKRILALTKLQAAENKQVEAFYAAAVESTNDIISLTQELASATGKDMSDLANDVVQAYARVYRGLIATIEESLPNQAGGGEGVPGRLPLASGGLFNTTGATDITVGEAGTETVAVLRNPRPFFSSGAGGGGGPQITILVTGNTVRNDQDLDEIARKVEQKLNQHGSLIGLRPPG